MDVRPTRSQGEDFHRAGDLARAEEVYRAVLRSEPADAQAWLLLGAVCRATGRGDEAIASFRRSPSGLRSCRECRRRGCC